MPAVALSWWRGGDRRRFVLRPRGCSQAGMTHAGQRKQTSDVKLFPTGPGSAGHSGAFLPVWGEEHLPSGRGPPHPPDQGAG